MYFVERWFRMARIGLDVSHMTRGLDLEILREHLIHDAEPDLFPSRGGHLDLDGVVSDGVVGFHNLSLINYD
jgi:hypothetical protein